MYFTDRGLEELEERRGEDRVTLAWLAERLREFIDLHPDAASPVDSLASWLARLDDDPDELDGSPDPDELADLGDVADLEDTAEEV
jgi:Family of unknown function (DUF6104)